MTPAGPDSRFQIAVAELQALDPADREAILEMLPQVTRDLVVGLMTAHARETRQAVTGHLAAAGISPWLLSVIQGDEPDGDAAAATLGLLRSCATDIFGSRKTETPVIRTSLISRILSMPGRWRLSR